MKGLTIHDWQQPIWPVLALVMDFRELKTFCLGTDRWSLRNHHIDLEVAMGDPSILPLVVSMLPKLEILVIRPLTSLEGDFSVLIGHPSLKSIKISVKACSLKSLSTLLSLAQLEELSVTQRVTDAALVKFPRIPFGSKLQLLNLNASSDLSLSLANILSRDKLKALRLSGTSLSLVDSMPMNAKEFISFNPALWVKIETGEREQSAAGEMLEQIGFRRKQKQLTIFSGDNSARHVDGFVFELNESGEEFTPHFLHPMRRWVSAVPGPVHKQYMEGSEKSIESWWLSNSARQAEWLSHGSSGIEGPWDLYR